MSDLWWGFDQIVALKMDKYLILKSQSLTNRHAIHFPWLCHIIRLGSDWQSSDLNLFLFAGLKLLLFPWVWMMAWDNLNATLFFFLHLGDSLSTSIWMWIHNYPTRVILIYNVKFYLCLSHLHFYKTWTQPPNTVTWGSFECNIHKEDAKCYLCFNENYFLCFLQDPNTATKHGLTPLHKAAMNGNLQCAKLLVQNGAQVNIADVAGNWVTKLKRRVKFVW